MRQKHLTMKKSVTLFFCMVVFGLVAFKGNAFAGDPISRMLGNDQDVFALVHVTNVSDEELIADVVYVFPNSKETPSGVMTINRDQQGYLSDTLTYFNYPYNSFDDKGLFLVSLNKTEDRYFVKWGMYEMTGDSYQNAKLLAIDFGDMAAVQWFVNTGGQGEFGSIDDKTFVNGDLEIFPTIKNLSLASGVQFENNHFFFRDTWKLAIILGTLVIVLFVFLFVRKGQNKKRRS